VFALEFLFVCCGISLVFDGCYKCVFGIVFRTLETVAPSKDSTYGLGTDAP
jgi:hypothetical protein